VQVVFGGSCGDSSKIGESIAKKLGLPFLKVEVTEFRDTEMLVRLPVEGLDPKGPREAELEGYDAIYVQSTAPAQSQHLIELFLTVENIKQRQAKSVTVVVPYLAHARQDKEFKAGEVISKNVIGKVLKSLGVDYLFTIDVHFHREVGQYEYEQITAYNATATGALAQYIRDKLKINSPKILIPDYGHKPIAEWIVPFLGDDIMFGKKERYGETAVSIVFPENERFKGRPAVIFDDMISSGTTCIAAAKYLKRMKASKIILAVTHTLYINGAREKLLAAGVDKIVATDTIPERDSVVPVGSIIADAMKQARTSPLLAVT
jgi:ribose-phosphate pyrophosphokinase